MTARTEAPAGQKRCCLHQELALRVYLLTDRKALQVWTRSTRGLRVSVDGHAMVMLLTPLLPPPTVAAVYRGPAGD